MSSSCRTALVAALLGLAGCGGPGTYPVEGVVVFSDGKPAVELAGGQVELEAQGQAASPRADIQPDGSFQITTLRAGDGAAPGTYRALIMPPPPVDFDKRPPPALELRYQQFDTSGLKVTVEPKANRVKLTIERYGK